MSEAATSHANTRKNARGSARASGNDNFEILQAIHWRNTKMATRLRECVGAEIIWDLILKSRWRVEPKELICAQVSLKTKGNEICGGVARRARKNLGLRIFSQ
jgi:hypothetical protein